MTSPAANQPRAPFALPPLPYADNALAPVVTANTIGFHYGKHHKAYVDNLNKLCEGDAALAAMSLEDLIKAVAGKAEKAGFFNNAAQVWNHSFYWHCLTPGGGGQPTGAIKARIESDLGGYDKFKADFSAAAMGQFGSGWAWLVVDGGKLKITRTANAETPLTQGQQCLLTLDVWEHAYYLDWQNRRADYAAAVIDKLLNWDFANQQLALAK